MGRDSADRVAKRGRMPAVSVRTRIVTVITLVAAIGMLSVGVAVYFVERAHVLQDVEDRLAANLESARFLVNEGENGSGSWPSSTAALRTVVQRMSPDDNTGALGIVAGEVAFVPGVPPDVRLETQPGFVVEVVTVTASGSPVIGTYTDGELVWRYLAAPIATPGSPPPTTVIFAMAYDVSAELAELNSAAQVFLLAAGIAVLAIGAVGSVVATRLLRPLREMRETAERVSANSLSERLPLHGKDDVSELAATMNDMLDRLEQALVSQRSLLSDVGHELKTPITIVRGYVEVMDPQDPADVRETQSLAVDELDRMGRLVQDLAGAAALYGPSPVQLRPVDAADLVHQIIRKAEGIDGARVETGDVADVVATIDPARITQAMLQLAQNAATHGGGRVVIGSRMAAGALEFSVRDFGPGVPDQAKTEIFERFHRGTDAEGRGTAGSGLGLDIVRVIARAHGGDVRVMDAQGGGAAFLLSVPLSEAGRTGLADGGAEVDSGIRPASPPMSLPATPPTLEIPEEADDGVRSHR